MYTLKKPAKPLSNVRISLIHFFTYNSSFIRFGRRQKAKELKNKLGFNSTNLNNNRNSTIKLKEYKFYTLCISNKLCLRKYKKQVSF